MEKSKTYYFNKEPNIIAKVTLTLKDTNSFSASGTIYTPTLDCGGQCLDEINKYFNTNSTFRKIYRLWKLYHLNDMHPECEHQHNLGWTTDARKKVIVREYFRTYDTIRTCDKITKKVMEFAKQGIPYTTTEYDRFYLTLPQYPKTYNEELNDPHYNLHKTETTIRGHLSYSETPFGLLGKPCPVCGYKYGTSWIKFNIPDEDLQQIKELVKYGD